MSETPEREIEIVAGVIEGVTQKKPDTWQVAVKPDGSQYSKNLWTKDAELVGSLTAKLGQHGAFVCSASYWTNARGAQVRSLWINQVTVEKPASSVATPAAAQKPSYAPDLKDRMIVRQAALKAAAAIVGPRAATTAHPDYDAALETISAATRFETWVYRDIDPVPFAPELSEHDDEIPF